MKSKEEKLESKFESTINSLEDKIDVLQKKLKRVQRLRENFSKLMAPEKDFIQYCRDRINFENTHDDPVYKKLNKVSSKIFDLPSNMNGTIWNDPQSRALHNKNIYCTLLLFREMDKDTYVHLGELSQEELINELMSENSEPMFYKKERYNPDFYSFEKDEFF